MIADSSTMGTSLRWRSPTSQKGSIELQIISGLRISRPTEFSKYTFYLPSTMSGCPELDDTLTTYGAFNGYPYGTIKAWMGNTHFKMRRLENVVTEFAQHILAYNMTRVMNNIGIPALIQAMRV